MSTTFTEDAQALPFPPTPPEPDWISAQGDTLLAIAEAAIVGAGLGEVFTRRARVVNEPVFRSFGQAGPNGQLYVWLRSLFLGRPGEEQFRDVYGNRGAEAFRVAEWSVQFGLPWPTLKSAGVAPTQDELATATHNLEGALGGVLAALAASAGGAYLNFDGTPIRPTRVATDAFLVGRATPLTTRGGFAGFEVPVALGL